MIAAGEGGVALGADFYLGFHLSGFVGHEVSHGSRHIVRSGFRLVCHIFDCEEALEVEFAIEYVIGVDVHDRGRRHVVAAGLNDGRLVRKIVDVVLLELCGGFYFDDVESLCIPYAHDVGHADHVAIFESCLADRECFAVFDCARGFGDEFRCLCGHLVELEALLHFNELSEVGHRHVADFVARVEASLVDKAFVELLMHMSVHPQHFRALEALREVAL